jgi:type I restriction enzyme R subunit
MITTEDEKDLLSNIIKTLNDTYGLNLTEEDKVDIQNIKIKLEENEELQAVMQADNPPDVVRYKFNQVIDQILLEFVHTKLDLYKKLTDPKVNELFKQKWFDGYVSEMG